MSSSTVDPNWWRQACVYQIYPRSFADDNGDGIGDLKGITSKVPYFQQLGIDAIWLSPFYPSALKDGGYDVADYRNVDPNIGTLEDFDAMSKACKEAGIKVIVDIVPNHCSDDHPWFQEALKSPPGSEARSRFHFLDGLGPDKSQPPADWDAAFGGPAWIPTGDGQFYLGIFSPFQPDFNWSHPDVRADFLKTLKFWGDRGVSGFRIDVAHALTKDLSGTLMTKAELGEWRSGPDANGKQHPLFDRDDVQDIYVEWRKVFDQYNPPLFAVAEAWVQPHRQIRYASTKGLGQTFSFDMLIQKYNRDQLKSCIVSSLRDAKRTGSSTTYVLSNHDVVRHSTRYGIASDGKEMTMKEWAEVGYEPFLKSGGKEPKCDQELGLKKARAVSLMMLALPGSAYLYQGEELGLPEVIDIPPAQRQDPTFINSKGEKIGRDGCRVPLPWTKEGKNFGFGTGAPAHLPQPEWMGGYAADVEDKDPKSTLNMYRQGLKYRRELQTTEDLEWVGDDKNVLHFKREGGWEVLTNFGTDAVEVPKGEVLVASGELQGDKVPQDVTVWVKTA
ncbi:putative alpha-glucosidase [Kockovaella imperatae]|uniref:Putative alpha-glucosidase n=1 Tax=Kockovaella imperatae TaxID=4999 RepID=A0A1Y1UN19_9TREE|nr:putative alpha-glucosidase [Kockovaella imperatae]ORX38846.1 putative alpha-glucosidase [Kockovaella imperatae]